jgi:hypothetical protein
MARAENDFHHIERSGSRFWPRKLSGLRELLLSSASSALKISSARFVLLLLPELPYVLRVLVIK